MLDHGDIVILYLYGLTEICRTGKNSSKNEFIFHPKNVLQNMLYLPLNLKL